MEDENTFLKAALSKVVQSVKPPLDKPTKKKSKPRSTPVELALIGQGMQKYGKYLKAVVYFLKKHCEVLGDKLRGYYENVGDEKAIERVRKLSQKSISKARLVYS